MNKIECTYPYNQINWGADGTMSPCCQLGKRRKLFGNIKTIEEYLKSKELEDLKTRLNNGEKVPECWRCWKQESLGIPSMREKAADKQVEKITELFITLGIQCNTACRICNPSRSSLIDKYNKDNIDLLKKLNIYTDDMYHYFPDGKVWYKNLLNDNEIFKNLELLAFTGGEPFINAHFDKLIDKIIRNKYDIDRIRITTNGSWTKESLARIKYFPEPNLCLSVDSLTEKYYEYLRWPLKWNDIKNRIQEAIDLKIKIDFQVVMHNLNILDFKDTLMYLVDNKFYRKDKQVAITFTVISQPNRYNWHVAPKRIKEKALEDLISIPDQYWKEFTIRPGKKELLTFMEKQINMPIAKQIIDELKSYITFTDSYRNVDTWKILGWNPEELHNEPI